MHHHGKQKCKPKDPQLLRTMEAIEVGQQTKVSKSKHHHSIKRKPQAIAEKSFGFSNPKLRSLCIAAFLRCLRAYISNPELVIGEVDESSVDEKRSNEDYEFSRGVQKQRVRQHLGEITALCKTTNLFDANIGLKYL